MPAIAVGFAGIINFGYDGSLMNGLLAMPLFLESIGNPDGNKLGIITAAYSLGVIIGSTMTSFISDRFGRKKTIGMYIYTAIYPC
jgi:MFS family permease